MSNIKTLVNDGSAEDFINAIDVETKRQDCFKLLEIYKRLTGDDPKMWGTSIIGFGKFHYKSEKNRQEGDWPLSAFSPRKQNLTLYFMPGFDDKKALLEKLGKHKISKSCLYLNKLADVDIAVLEHLIEQCHLEMKKKYDGQDA